MGRIKDPNSKNVFVIVRERAEVKAKLISLASKSGFDQLSDFLRTKWREWL